MTTATLPANVFQSKWGFHPCDHETFLKLKRLNFYSELSKRLNAKLERWERKATQNRFVKLKPHERLSHAVFEDGTKYMTYESEWAKDASGNRIPWIEPETVPGKYAYDFIAENYRRARFPVSDPALVKPITLAPEHIDAELKMLERWYFKYTCGTK